MATPNPQTTEFYTVIYRVTGNNVWQARAYWVFSGATIAAFVSIGAYVLAVLYGIICTTLALASEGMAHD